MTHDHFQLRRRSDDLIYHFDRTTRPDGTLGYKRQDMDLWITRDQLRGWVARDPITGEIQGIPWNIQPGDQGDYPPEGEWVSKKGNKSYVYDLVYVD